MKKCGRVGGEKVVRTERSLKEKEVRIKEYVDPFVKK